MRNVNLPKAQFAFISAHGLRGFWGTSKEHIEWYTGKHTGRFWTPVYHSKPSCVLSNSIIFLVHSDNKSNRIGFVGESLNMFLLVTTKFSKKVIDPKIIHLCCKDMQSVHLSNTEFINRAYFSLFVAMSLRELAVLNIVYHHLLRSSSSVTLDTHSLTKFASSGKPAFTRSQDRK